MRDRQEEPLFPPNPAPYLSQWLFEIGPVSTGSMGEGPLSYLEMAAWQSVSGVELMPWEASLLRRLSAEYASMRHKAEEQGCAAPYSGADLESSRASVDAKIRAAFANLKGKRG